MKNYILMVLGILATIAVGVSFFWWRYSVIVARGREHDNLLKLQTTEITRLRNKVGQQRAIAEVVELSKRNLEAVNAAHIAAIEKAFDTKIKRVQAVMRLSVTTSGKAAMPARDTSVILPRDSLPTKLKQYRYADQYFQMSAIADADSLHVTHYSVRNDITAIAHRAKRPRWWKFWKPRPIQCQVFLFNPHSGIDTIEIQTLSK